MPKPPLLGNPTALEVLQFEAEEKAGGGRSEWCGVLVRRWLLFLWPAGRVVVFCRGTCSLLVLA